MKKLSRDTWIQSYSNVRTVKTKSSHKTLLTGWKRGLDCHMLTWLALFFSCAEDLLFPVVLINQLCRVSQEKSALSRSKTFAFANTSCLGTKKSDTILLVTYRTGFKVTCILKSNCYIFLINSIVLYICFFLCFNWCLLMLLKLYVCQTLWIISTSERCQTK